MQTQKQPPAGGVRTCVILKRRGPDGQLGRSGLDNHHPCANPEPKHVLLFGFLLCSLSDFFHGTAIAEIMGHKFFLAEKAQTKGLHATEILV